MNINLADRRNKAKFAVVLLIMVVMAACFLCACDPAGASVDRGGESNETEKTAGDIAEATVPQKTSHSTESSQNTASEGSTVEKKLTLSINGQNVLVHWRDNESVEALKDLVRDKPLVIRMSMYGGVEQVGSLGTSLPRNDSQITTVAGDIVLYSGNQIVVFYGSNSWAYTELGHITDKTAREMSELLGTGNATMEISIK